MPVLPHNCAEKEDRKAKYRFILQLSSQSFAPEMTLFYWIELYNLNRIRVLW